MKKLWILFAIAVVLFFMRFRERFEATENIKDPATWTDVEIDRIKSMTDPKSTEENAIVKAIVGGFWPIWKQETLRVTLNDVTTYLDGQPYIQQTPSKRNEYVEMLKKYYITQGQPLFLESRGYNPNDFSSYLGRSEATTTEKAKESGTSSSASNVDPVCPADRTINSTKTECDLEFSLCGPGFEATSDQKCKSINGNQIQDNIYCPPGTTFNSTSKKCKSGSVPPTCPDNYTFQRVDNKGTCKSNTTQTSNTTGGSSGNIGGVSGGPSQENQAVFGPLFNGTGSNIVGDNTDSSKTNKYPKLMGGTSGFANTGRSDTARMMLPIQESKFPGDLDFIPDPYRVSLTYNASSYSSGREPIPFLTDFSAFQK